VQANILDAADVAVFRIPPELNIDHLGTLADFQAGEEQLVQVLLIYKDDHSAQAAALELGQRVE
jgi:hypothetical protein